MFWKFVCSLLFWAAAPVVLAVKATLCADTSRPEFRSRMMLSLTSWNNISSLP